VGFMERLVPVRNRLLRLTAVEGTAEVGTVAVNDEAEVKCQGSAFLYGLCDRIAVSRPVENSSTLAG
jgi:hypothetical protein